MALPTFVAAGATNASIGDLALALPAGLAADDILIAAIECAAADTAVLPGGWAHVTGSPIATATGTKLNVAWKRAGGSESAPTFTDAGDHQAGALVAVRGCITTGNPWDVVNTSVLDASDTAVAFPSVTTTVADCLVLNIIANGRDVDTTTGIGSWTNAALANLTERLDFWSSLGSGGGVGLATGEAAAAGVVGQTTATLAGGAGTQAHMTLALKPPTPAAGGNRSNRMLVGVG